MVIASKGTLYDRNRQKHTRGDSPLSLATEIQLRPVLHIKLTDENKVRLCRVMWIITAPLKSAHKSHRCGMSVSTDCHTQQSQLQYQQ